MSDRRYVALAAVILICCITVLWACGSDEASEENDGGQGFDLEEFEEGLDRYESFDDAELRYVLSAEAICEVVWGCAGEIYEGAFASSDPIGQTSKAECIDLLTETELADGPTPEEQLAYEEGRITVDREGLPDCRETFLTEYCSEGFGEDFYSGHPCAQVFSGEVSAGGFCNFSEECRGSLTCDYSDDAAAGDDACHGVCAEVDDPHSSCNGEDCGSDEYCNRTDYDDARCRPLIEEGEPCELQYCAHGLWCSPEAVCSPIEMRSEGESCHWGHDFCEAGTVCFEDDPSADEGQCREAGRDGDDCRESRHCTYPLVCLSDDDGQGTCGLAAIGEPCSWNEHCAEGRCYPGGPDSHCILPGENGDHCEWFGECQSNYCDESTMECADYEVCEIP